MTSEALTDLEDRIANNRVVLVTGTGVSTSLCGDNPPPFLRGWAACIVELGRECQRSFGLNYEWWQQIGFSDLQGPLDLPQATDTIAEVSERLVKWHQGIIGAWYDYEIFNHLAYKVFGSLQVKDTAMAEALDEIGIPVLTTNYDILHELATARIPLSLRSISQNGWFQYLEGAHPGTKTVHSRYVVHLHGTFHDTQDIVLSRSQYANTMNTFKNTMANLVTGNFSPHVNRNSRTTSLLFVGALGTVADDHFRTLWRELEARCSTANHYILVRDEEVEPTQVLLSNHDGTSRVRIISYGKEYKDLVPFIHSLKPRSPRPSPSPIPLHPYQGQIESQVHFT